MFLASGADGDLDVLAQSRKEFHQASNEKTAGTVRHQQGNLGLLHTENLGNLRLCHAAVLENRVDLQPELRAFGAWGSGPGIGLLLRIDDHKVNGLPIQCRADYRIRHSRIASGIPSAHFLNQNTRATTSHKDRLAIIESLEILKT